jgi:hypothetical protein
MQFLVQSCQDLIGLKSWGLSALWFGLELAVWHIRSVLALCCDVHPALKSNCLLVPTVFHLDQFWSYHPIATRCNHDEMVGCKANPNPNIEINAAISYSEGVRFCLPRGPA